MVDLATPPEEIIAEIRRVVLERLHPRRVILIGSRARNDARPDSDYDIVVEFDTDARTASRLGDGIYSLFPDRGWHLNVIARATGEIERSADDPGTVDWDVAREGKVLYAAEGVTTITRPPGPPPPPSVRERRQPPDSAGEWARLAHNDFELARFTATHGNQWGHVCFCAQQAAEKFLKALLVRNFVRPPRIHALDETLKSVRAVGVALPGLDADCSLLTPYAVKPRYSPAEEYSEQQGRAAIAAAERIEAAVSPHFA